MAGDLVRQPHSSFLYTMLNKKVKRCWNCGNTYNTNLAPDHRCPKCDRRELNVFEDILHKLTFGYWTPR